MLLVLALTTLLVIGIKESARFNNIIVVVKVLIVLLVIGFGFKYVEHRQLDAVHSAEPRRVRPVRLDAACSAPRA